MAGAFGFEPDDHYDVSIKCGERLLLPKVREADDSTIICADGFSCREQIHQCTDREALHLAQVLQMALHQPKDQNGDRLESRLIQQRRRARLNANVRAAGILLGASLAAIWLLKRPRRQLA